MSTKAQQAQILEKLSTLLADAGGTAGLWLNSNDESAMRAGAAALRASDPPYVVGDNGSPADFQVPIQAAEVERCSQCGEPFDHPNHNQHVPVSVVPTIPHPFTVAADPVTGPPCPAERHSDGAHCLWYAGHLGTHAYPPVRETALCTNCKQAVDVMVCLKNHRSGDKWCPGSGRNIHADLPVRESETGWQPLEQFLIDYRQWCEVENEARGEWFWLDQIEDRIGKDRYRQIMHGTPLPVPAEPQRETK